MMTTMGFQETKQPMGADRTIPETNTVEVIDLSITLNDQLYPCKVIINEAAERGGPAILFLHGYGECGTDNEKQLTVGLPKHAAENPEKWPYVLIVPQKPIFNTEWQDHEEAILKLLQDADQQGLYDPDRLGITGLSQGGHGTIILAAKYPELFQAAAPVCGYTERRISKDQERLEENGASPTDPEVMQAAEGLSNIPTWFVHGDKDSVVPVSESRSLFGALKELDANTRYTELADVDHNSWDHAYTDRDLIDWFKEHLGE
ncbi:MAG: prolyl oligopeptidase family serine peptidase [Phycisphaerales bacterium]